MASSVKKNNLIIRAYQPVCEKHFLPEDIIWRRIFTDKDGNIIGEVSNHIVSQVKISIKNYKIYNYFCEL